MVDQKMVRLIAPTACNEVVHGGDVYAVKGGIVTVPYFIHFEISYCHSTQMLAQGVS